MKRLCLFLFLFSSLQAQTKILSWNLENFGKSKSDTAIAYVVHTLKDYGIIAIQEVVTGYGGA